MTRRRGAWLVAAVVIALPVTAAAHGRSASYSEWTMRDDGATVDVRFTALDGTAIAAAHADYLLHAVSAPGCEPSRLPQPLTAPRGWERYELELACTARPTRIRSDLLVDLVPAHLHFATVRGVTGELVLTDGRREASLPRPGGSPGLAGYVRLGFTHILGGADHLIFLLALVLVAGSLREVAVAATGFTVGHSVTLALATLGYAAPDTAAVEALIGLSIALVAAENVWLAGGRRDAPIPAAALAALLVAAAAGTSVPAGALLGLAALTACSYGLLARADHPARWRAVAAALFGLVHGFGFAGALPATDRIAGPLLGFNAGVELGQLAVLAAAWPALTALRRLDHRATIHAGSAAALCAGVFWFLTRA